LKSRESSWLYPVKQAIPTTELQPIGISLAVINSKDLLEAKGT